MVSTATDYKIPYVAVLMARSNTQVDRAGDRLRDWMLGQGNAKDLDEPELDDALKTLLDWRSEHGLSLDTVTAALSRLLPSDATTQPTARLKRAAAIVMKLVRFRHMRLSQMEDVGGARVTLRSQERIDALLERLRERWADASLDDYVVRPKDGGYRAKHLVVVVMGKRIEIQLRTHRQNLWADEVEKWAAILDHPLKDGKGPADLVRYFEVAAELQAQLDRDERPDYALRSALADLRKKVEPYFQRDS